MYFKYVLYLQRIYRFYEWNFGDYKCSKLVLLMFKK